MIKVEMNCANLMEWTDIIVNHVVLLCCVVMLCCFIWFVFNDFSAHVMKWLYILHVSQHGLFIIYIVVTCRSLFTTLIPSPT